MENPVKVWALHGGLVVAMLGCKTPEETTEERRREWLDYRPASEVLVYCVDSRGVANDLLEAAVSHASRVNARLLGFVVIEDARVRCIPQEGVSDKQAALEELGKNRGDVPRGEEDALSSAFRLALNMASVSPSASRRILYIGNGRLDEGMSFNGILSKTASRNWTRVPIDCLVDDPAVMKGQNVSLVFRTAKMSGGILFLDLDG